MKRPTLLPITQTGSGKAGQRPSVSVSTAIPAPNPCGETCRRYTDPAVEANLGGSGPPPSHPRSELAAVPHPTKSIDRSAVGISVTLLRQIEALPFSTVEIGHDLFLKPRAISD
ncbi:hypothetical protein QO005_004605 [Rhizobium paknamense]|uniref:Uncharacterized protein n=1 Tax=Rhizobium paknamense TaxID=1206817 RepID=A0ABU0IJ17_9HYPH|nr:hypothetical protein [Rhizobium paknamense]